MLLLLPRFFRDGVHRDHILSQLKMVVCPHCGRANELICNGKLHGNNPASHRDERIVRGQRIRCSNRGQRQGCGRSFAIFEARWPAGGNMMEIRVWPVVEGRSYKLQHSTEVTGMEDVTPDSSTVEDGVMKMTHNTNSETKSFYRIRVVLE